MTPGQTYRPTIPKSSRAPNEVLLLCSERAEVIVTIYSPDNEELAPPRLKSRQGSVRIHDGYEFSTDTAGSLTASRMDLAAIHLDKPFEDVRPDSKLAVREVQPEETLFVIGYGIAPSERWGIRHFGKNQVMEMAISVGGDGLFSFRGSGEDKQGAHAWRGDSGGPCFREDADGNRWLAGIISMGQLTRRGALTHFTSVFHHRAWINAQMDLSEKTSAREKGATR